MRAICLFLLWVSLALNLIAQPGSANPGTPPLAVNSAANQVQSAGEALQKGDFKNALVISREVIATSPDNIVAYNLAGNASLRLHEYANAIEFFRHALQLQPDEYHNVGGLMAAYSLAGKTAEADAEREHIRQLKAANRLPPGFNFQIDTFDVSDKQIWAVEFFPDLGGKFNYRYSFNVFDVAGKQVYRVALESDDVDQPMFAKEHPKEAAAGKRAFSLDGYGPGSHATIKFYEGEPTYATARDDAKQFIAGNLHAITQSTQQQAPGNTPATPGTPSTSNPPPK